MITIRNLSKCYDGVRAVDSISFEIGRGDTFGFIGPNGAGKTTTMKIMATLLDPTSGDISVDGVSVVNNPEKIRMMIGFMPDDYGVYDGMLVTEFLEFFARCYHIPRANRKKIISDVMDLTEVCRFQELEVQALSKGMRQRLCLAKTLLHNPKLLILDEPAAGLDPRARIELRELLKELRSMGKTTVISSHILTELADMCNTVGVIDRGRMLKVGDVERISNELIPNSTVEFRFLDNRAKAIEIMRASGMFSEIRDEPRLVVGVLTDRDQKVSRLIPEFVKNGVRLASFNEKKVTLEDVFLSITRKGGKNGD